MKRRPTHSHAQSECAELSGWASRWWAGIVTSTHGTRRPGRVIHAFSGGGEMRCTTRCADAAFMKPRFTASSHRAWEWGRSQVWIATRRGTVGSRSRLACMRRTHKISPALAWFREPATRRACDTVDDAEAERRTTLESAASLHLITQVAGVSRAAEIGSRELSSKGGNRC